MNISVYHRGMVLFFVGVAVLGMIWVRETGTNPSLSQSTALPCIFWDGSDVILTRGQHNIQAPLDANMPPRLRPLFFQPVPINSADKDLLMTIPGIGPATATNILRMRDTYGAIEDADDLLHIQGIGRKKKANLAKHFSY